MRCAGLAVARVLKDDVDVCRGIWHDLHKGNQVRRRCGVCGEVRGVAAFRAGKGVCRRCELDGAMVVVGGVVMTVGEARALSEARDK